MHVLLKLYSCVLVPYCSKILTQFLYLLINIITLGHYNFWCQKWDCFSYSNPVCRTRCLQTEVAEPLKERCSVVCPTSDNFGVRSGIA